MGPRLMNPRSRSPRRVCGLHCLDTGRAGAPFPLASRLRRKLNPVDVGSAAVVAHPRVGGVCGTKPGKRLCHGKQTIARI